MASFSFRSIKAFLCGLCVSCSYLEWLSLPGCTLWLIDWIMSNNKLKVLFFGSSSNINDEVSFKKIWGWHSSKICYCKNLFVNIATFLFPNYDYELASPIKFFYEVKLHNPIIKNFEIAIFDFIEQYCHIVGLLRKNLRFISLCTLGVFWRIHISLI